MITKSIKNKTSIEVEITYSAETLEETIQRRLKNKEPMDDNIKLLYTPITEGVKSGFNIRSDRWDIALDAINKIEKSKTVTTLNVLPKEETKVEESIQAT